jgi:hypothetical protein
MYVYQRLIHYTIMVTLLGITKISEKKKTGNVTASQVRDDWWRNAPWIYPA